ncbi:MAG: sulfatase [Tepidisphaeraceae bacterium]
MRRISRIGALLLLLAFASWPGRPVLAAEAPSTAQPSAGKTLNVLFIAVDDLRPELGCYGVEGIKTPNLDALAARGLLFGRAYCQQAVCSPSRTSLLTGRRPDSTKVYDLETHFRKNLPDVVTLPQHFKQSGYHAQSFGKIFHGGLDDAPSWSAPHTTSKVPQYISKEILAEVKRRGATGLEVGGKNKGPAWESGECDDNALPDGYIADRAIEAMRAVKDKPFFLAVGFVKPHLPLVAPKKYFDLYPIDQFHLPEDYRRPEGAPDVAMHGFGELRAYQGMPKTGPLPEKQALELIRAYYASASFMDAQVARLLAELDRLKLRDNTIVILWGDHGWHLGDQGLWCKHTNFDVATHVPLILSVPGAPTAGAKTNALVEFVDIFPSLCDLAGLPKPDGLEGTSFVPLLAEPTRPWKKYAISQYPRPGQKAMGYSLRSDRYRYTEWQRIDDAKQVIARELYDHETDPHETKNLAGDPAMEPVVTELSGQLSQGWRGALP